MNENENKTIMYCYRCRKCTMVWNGHMGIINQQGYYCHCYKCGSPSIKFFHIDNGKITTEEPPIENAVVLSEKNVPANVPHGDVLGELYAIRSAMAMISKNIDDIECAESVFIKIYGNEYFKQKLEAAFDFAFKQYMGKWQKYYVPTIIEKDRKLIEEKEKNKEKLQQRIGNLRNTKVGFFQGLKKKREIKSLEAELERLERSINADRAHIEQVEKETQVKGKARYDYEHLFCVHCTFLSPWDFPERVYYLESRDIEALKEFQSDYISLKLYLSKLDTSGFYAKTVSAITKFMSQEEKDDLERERQERLEGSRQLVEAARAAYKIIDFRDWKNVDLLIYYFETGRADDLKEALQLVDRQLQTNQIVEAINMASAEIGKTIRQSMEALGGALAQSFSLLSAQIQAQGQAIQAAVSQQTAAINEYGAAQVNNQRMANALLSSIDKSSARLAEDMDRQMKEVYHIN